MPVPAEEITQLLHAWHAGEAAAFDRLIPLVYEDLHGLAQRALRRQAPGHTLQTTAVINEAWLRLRMKGGIEWEGRTHFFAVAARAMRFLLVDHARKHQQAKQGGGATHIQLEEAGLEATEAATLPWPIEVLALDQALQRLAALDAQKSRIVELRYFAGMNVEEVAEVQGIAVITVKREWARAKAWLYHELNTPAPTPTPTEVAP